MRQLGRVAEAALVGLAIAVVIAGLALVAVMTPWFTRALTTRFDVASAAGLTRAQAAEAAEQVRAFVAHADAPALPARVGARSGFDEAAVSHLEDVRRVMRGMWTAAAVLAIAVVLWIAACLFRRRWRALGAGLAAGAIVCVALPIVAAAAGAADFGRLFAGFHGLFFASGTWTFPADALLITLFPEQFWITAGVVFGALIVTGGALLGLAAALIRRRSPRVA